MQCLHVDGKVLTSKHRLETNQSLLLSSMLAERDQLRDASKPLSPHGSEMAREEKKDRDPLSLDEEIAEDPYVSEGEALLNELLGRQS